MIQYHPESLRTMKVPVSRPRVFLIDFEVAVEFASDCPYEACLCIGPPAGGSIGPGDWGRPLPSEVSSGKTYSPFKLDVWQFGFSFTGLYTFRVRYSAPFSSADAMTNKPSIVVDDYTGY